MKQFFLSIIMSFFMISGFSQSSDTIIYKNTPERKLTLKVYYPENWKVTDSRKSIIFFFGGGWQGRNFNQFDIHAKYLATRGMVSFVADYRVTRDAKNLTPKDCIMDAKSAMRYIRSHAIELGISPDSIAASGGSAGGHLAASTACISQYNDPNDDLSISCVPNALILFNPVINNGPDGYGYDRVKDYYKSFSPTDNIHEGMPPTLIMVGTKDKYVSQTTVLDFQKRMIEHNNQCDIYYYSNQLHGFFNKGKTNDSQYFHRTFSAMVSFLEGLNYIKARENFTAK